MPWIYRISLIEFEILLSRLCSKETSTNKKQATSACVVHAKIQIIYNRCLFENLLKLCKKF